MSVIDQPILITGAAGFIGSNLLRKLIKKNYHVHVLLSKNSNLWRIKQLKKNSSFHFVDLEKEIEIEKIIKKIKPKTIFHLAAHGAYSYQKNKKKIKKVNFDATVSLIENCKIFGFTKFINTGSSSEYGFRNNKMAEKDMVSPNSDYAVYKSLSSIYCQYEAIINKLPIVTLRPFHVYGPFEDQNRLIPTLIRNLHNNLVPKLVSPNISRDLIYIDDVIDVYINSCNNNKINGEIINLASGRNIKLSKIFEVIKKEIKSDIKPTWNSMKNRDWDQEYWVADIQKFKKLYNNKKLISLDTGIMKFYSWYKKNYKYYNAKK